VNLPASLQAPSITGNLNLGLLQKVESNYEHLPLLVHPAWCWLTLYRHKLKVVDLCKLAEKSGLGVGRKRLTKDTLIDLLLNTTPQLVLIFHVLLIWNWSSQSNSTTQAPPHCLHKGPWNVNGTPPKLWTQSARHAQQLRELTCNNYMQPEIQPEVINVWNWVGLLDICRIKVLHYLI